MSAGELILATGSAPAAPAANRVTLYAGTDNKLYLKDAAGTAEQVGSGGGGTVYLWRNALINGSFAIWQRQSDPAATTEYADDEYCADRWYVLSQSNPIDAERIGGDTQRYAIRLTQKNATSQQIGMAQIIEGANCQHLRGQEVTFSIRVQCSAAETVNVAVLEWGGTEDSVTSDVAASWSGSGLPTLAASVTQAGSTGQTALSAATWADVSTTVTLGSSFENLILFVWTDTTLAQNVTLDLEAAQLERGGVATPFEARPVGAELALCQRYFERLGGNVDSEQLGPGFARNANVFFSIIQYQQKRTTPSVSYTGTFEISTVGVITGSIVATNDIGPSSFFNQFENVGSFTAGYAGAFRTVTASSYIAIDAEI